MFMYLCMFACVYICNRVCVSVCVCVSVYAHARVCVTGLVVLCQTVLSKGGRRLAIRVTHGNADRAHVPRIPIHPPTFLESAMAPRMNRLMRVRAFVSYPEMV